MGSIVPLRPEMSEFGRGMLDVHFESLADVSYEGLKKKILSTAQGHLRTNSIQNYFIPVRYTGHQTTSYAVMRISIVLMSSKTTVKCFVFTMNANLKYSTKSSNQLLQ